jgi:NAD-dependent deacetylase
MEPIFFILGAGASVDSGLPTYRGPKGFYDEYSYENITKLISNKTLCETPKIIWDFFEPLYKQVISSQPGQTYQLIKELAKNHPNSFILTQNIDGIASQYLDIPVVEIHGNIHHMICSSCGKQVVNFETSLCRCGKKCVPDIVLFGDNLGKDNVNKMHELLKKNKPKYVLIIGTTMQFPYLRNFISISKTKKCNRYHINPDGCYYPNIAKKEKFINMTASDGLRNIIDQKILNNEQDNDSQ